MIVTTARQLEKLCGELRSAGSFGVDTEFVRERTYFIRLGIMQVACPDVEAILWGFFFFFGLAVAFGVRWLMEKAGVAHLMDPGIQRRITGWAIDYLIIATAAAIEFAVILEYLLPISLMALLVVLVIKPSGLFGKHKELEERI